MQVSVLLLNLLMLLVFQSKDQILTREVSASMQSINNTETKVTNMSSISYTKKISSQLLDRKLDRSHHHKNFIDFFLDANLYNQISQSINIENELLPVHDPDQAKNNINAELNSTKICSIMFNVLGHRQRKFCKKHSVLVQKVFKQVLQATKDECRRLSTDLRWNCFHIDPFLDRSNPLSSTREASLLKSLLSALMAYFVAVECASGGYSSCRCINIKNRDTDAQGSSTNKFNSLKIMETNFGVSAKSHTNAEHLIGLTKLTYYQDCSPNIAFGVAFSATFLDQDDLKVINKVHRIFYPRASQNLSASKVMNNQILEDRDITILKWTKSASNLHNYHVGRQVFRSSNYVRCRCHGLFGECNFQICKAELRGIEFVTNKLRDLYLHNSQRAYADNTDLGDNLDLRLGIYKNDQSNTTTHDSVVDKSIPEKNNLNSIWLSYLSKSPDYCLSIESIKHSNTKGRLCKLYKDKDLRPDNNLAKDRLQTGSFVGSCDYLCCGRGYRYEIRLELASCNCKFEFCCRVQCGSCLQQRRVHYCL